MARTKSIPWELPGNTMVELVGTNGTKSKKLELTLDDARKKKAELEQETKTVGNKRIKKWIGWKFQIFQLGFSAFRSNDDQTGDARE